MILALETATAACSAALCDAGGSVVAESVVREGPAHCQRLLPAVRTVLEATGMGWDDVDTVAVGLGPGAFTGLRIGVATARALAQADGRARLAGVPTPAALALALALADGGAGGRDPGLLVPLIDGKRGEVFAAAYRGGAAGLRIVEEITVVGAAGLSSWLVQLGAVTVGGDGASLYADLLPPSARRSTVGGPTAAMVGRAVARGAPGMVVGPAAVLPLYGRAPDAARWSGRAQP